MQLSLSEIAEFAREGYNPGKVFNEHHFKQDFYLFSSTKRLVNKFLKKGVVEERLMLNNIVCLLNVFGKDKVNKVFRLLTDDVQFSVIKAALMFLRQYDFSISQNVYPNRIMVDVLRDMERRHIPRPM